MKFTEEELERIKKEKMEEIDRWLDNEFGISYTRYKNIIDEIEAIVYADISNIDARISIQEALDKLKELKGSDR